jgi:hypothetical protein
MKGLAIILSCVICLWVILPSWQQAEPAVSTPDPTTITAKTATGAEVITVKGIDDPDNPYKGQYERWDLWVYANMVASPTIWKAGERPENWDSLAAEADENGYLIPLLQTSRNQEQALSEGRREEYRNSVFEVYAEGELPTEVVEDYLREAYRVRAGVIAKIPDWLAEDPPAYSMLLPNGDVITDSKLGETDESRALGGETTWYRYNQAGELTGQSTETWWGIYYREKYGDTRWPAGDFENRIDGYVFFKDRDTQQILSVWDYDATQLDAALDPQPRDPHPFMMINGRMLGTLSQLQQGDS